MLIFAHGTETHDSTAESVGHLLGPWYAAIVIMLVVLAMIGYLTYLVSNKNIGSVILIESVVLLVIGFVSATTYPLISVLSITIGIILAGFMAFAGLAAGE